MALPTTTGCSIYPFFRMGWSRIHRLHDIKDYITRGFAMINKVLLCCLFFLLAVLPQSSWSACSWNGNIGTSASCTVSDLSACITDASAKTGDVTIKLPVCSVTWVTNVEFDMTSGFQNIRSLNITGAGTPQTRSAAASGTSIHHDGGYFSITTAETKKLRISNITYTGTAYYITKDKYGNDIKNYMASVCITGFAKVSSGGGFRIDHMTFSPDSRAVGVRQAVGVVDSSTRAGGGQVFNVSGGSSTEGNIQWNTANNFGGADQVVFENNNIYCDSSCASPVMFCDVTDGGRITIRYNYIKNHYVGGHDASSVARGVMQIEDYNNEHATTGYQYEGAFSLRGGSGRVFNNYLTTDQANSTDAFFEDQRPYGISMMNYRSHNTKDCAGTLGLWVNRCSASGSEVKGCLGSGATYSNSVCTSDSACGGSGCEYIDNLYGGTDKHKGYPCRDQIGRGTGQTGVPMLFWNNKISFAGATAVTATPNVYICAATDIQENRDYCHDATTMPATCNGVTTSYAPYTCPHPLVGPGVCNPSVAGVEGYLRTAVSYDFNTDSKSDILWYNSTTGDVSVWFMDGTTLIIGSSIGTIDTGWQIKGVGDFNGDGNADILWYNVATGGVSIWFMNGAAILFSGDVGSANLAWQIKGVGDFNGDGNADILWYNAATGGVSMWLMSGTTILSGHAVGSANTALQIKGVGDFNGDGNADILWYNAATGGVSMWLMSGTTILSGHAVGSANTALQIKGVGDFNGDGNADILWYNAATGGVSMWLMSGTTILSGHAVGSANTALQIKGVGDFNGDGNADILWYNAATGGVSMWLMSGTTILSGHAVGTANTTWQIVGN